MAKRITKGELIKLLADRCDTCSKLAPEDDEGEI